MNQNTDYLPFMKNLILLILSLLLAQQSIAQTFDVEGHRGSRGLMPENTLQAFKKALDLGVTTLEMDVCISKDFQVVVSHEPYMSALYVSKPDGSPVNKEEEFSFNLYQMTYQEIKQFDTGKRGNTNFPEQEKIAAYKPLLSETIEACEAYIKEKGFKPVQYNIEIKSEEKEYGTSQPKTVEEFSKLVYQIIIKKLPANRVILQSFDFNVLKYWHTQIEKRKYKKIALSALVEQVTPEKTFEELGFLPDYFSPYYKLLTIEQVTFCHNRNVKVVPWTVNNSDDMKKIKAIGIDGLITDYPNRAKDL
jgi:glycerophosphoryl diester phosphodiesterase